MPQESQEQLENGSDDYYGGRRGPIVEGLTGDEDHCEGKLQFVPDLPQGARFSDGHFSSSVQEGMRR